jgi:hypothetical protein
MVSKYHRGVEGFREEQTGKKGLEFFDLQHFLNARSAKP